MTKDEANKKCEELSKLNFLIWKTVDKDKQNELVWQFKKIFREISCNGFRVSKRKVPSDEFSNGVWKYKVKDDGSENLVDIINNRPAGTDICGDCTTRCICFCTGADYNEVQAEQKMNAQAYRAYGVTWKSSKIWMKSFEKRGFTRIWLPRKVTRKTFLKLFKDSGIKGVNEGVIGTVSSRHIAAIDMAKMKILDTWNSSGGRVNSIVVPKERQYEYQYAIAKLIGCD